MKKFFINITLALALAIVSPLAASARADVDDIAQSEEIVMSVKPVNGGLQISVNDDETHQFYVYSITGQMVKSVNVSETIVVDLPQGCYIVKCKQWSKKIVIR
ncbi:MAG: T9SS type A sorting domain-containing protein [Muribaculum sp.]|nr:T9SS type A sorting domain-containing protein [Muribaculaceae bacterium]MCM1080722.1 T9SS type A sorting domain-containing protein [Muribaculum sp.]